MSIDKNYYTIAGYDLTGWETDKYDDWKWTEEGSKYIGYQHKGEIQLFDDPVNEEHLYFGYIFANGDEYNFETSKIDIGTVNQVKGYVEDEFAKLVALGVISKDPHLKPKYQVITFEECL